MDKELIVQSRPFQIDQSCKQVNANLLNSRWLAPNHSITNAIQKIKVPNNFPIILNQFLALTRASYEYFFQTCQRIFNHSKVIWEVQNLLDKMEWEPITEVKYLFVFLLGLNLDDKSGMLF